MENSINQKLLFDPSQIILSSRPCMGILFNNDNIDLDNSLNWTLLHQFAYDNYISKYYHQIKN